MVMAQVIHEKGGPEKCVWEKVALDPPEEGEVHIRNLAIGVNFADTYHRRGWPHPLVVGAPADRGWVRSGFDGRRSRARRNQLQARGQSVPLHPADRLLRRGTDLPGRAANSSA